MAQPIHLRAIQMALQNVTPVEDLIEDYPLQSLTDAGCLLRVA